MNGRHCLVHTGLGCIYALLSRRPCRRHHPTNKAWHEERGNRPEHDRLSTQRWCQGPFRPPARTAVNHSHQPLAPTTRTNHSHQPLAPTTRTNHFQEPLAVSTRNNGPPTPSTCRHSTVQSPTLTRGQSATPAAAYPLSAAHARPPEGCSLRTGEGPPTPR